MLALPELHKPGSNDLYTLSSLKHRLWPLKFRLAKGFAWFGLQLRAQLRLNEEPRLLEETVVLFTSNLSGPRSSDAILERKLFAKNAFAGCVEPFL